MYALWANKPKCTQKVKTEVQKMTIDDQHNNDDFLIKLRCIYKYVQNNTFNYKKTKIYMVK